MLTIRPGVSRARAVAAVITYWRIQHAESTGRFHPVAYRDTPLPGPGPDPARRFKSYGHHTEGYETEQAARERVAADCEKLGMAVPDPLEVDRVAEPGADVYITRMEMVR